MESPFRKVRKKGRAEHSSAGQWPYKTTAIQANVDEEERNYKRKLN